MGNNGHQGQIQGPFQQDEELIDRIRQESYPEAIIQHIGVQTEEGTFIKVNGKKIMVGKTKVYEVGNTEINSICFLKDVDKNTLIDYVIR